MLRPPTERRPPDDEPRRVPELLICAGLAAWFVATAASQHPQRAFDRVFGYDPTGLLVPDFRFFGPEPVKHDFHVIQRVTTTSGEPAPWREVTRIPARAWHHAVWFPDRRRDKAMFDVCRELVGLAALPKLDVATTTPFQLVRDFVALRVRREASGSTPPQGFQFLIARHTGYDPAHDPEYLFLSPYVALADCL
jgi:hypothetical protein